MENMGLLIKKQREKINMSQTDLADRLNVNRSYVSKMESGRTPISLKRLDQIGKVLDCDFFSGIDQDNELYEKWKSVIEVFEEKELTPEEVINIMNVIDIIKNKF